MINETSSPYQIKTIRIHFIIWASNNWSRQTNGGQRIGQELSVEGHDGGSETLRAEPP